jgi:hypothetical protein
MTEGTGAPPIPPLRIRSPRHCTASLLGDEKRNKKTQGRNPGAKIPKQRTQAQVPSTCERGNFRFKPDPTSAARR